MLKCFGSSILSITLAYRSIRFQFSLLKISAMYAECCRVLRRLASNVTFSSFAVSGS